MPGRCIGSGEPAQQRLRARDPRVKSVIVHRCEAQETALSELGIVESDE